MKRFKNIESEDDLDLIMAQLEILRKSEHDNIIKYIEWFTENHKYGKYYFLVTAYYKVCVTIIFLDKFKKFLIHFEFIIKIGRYIR